MYIISKPSDTRNFIPFTTAAIAHYGATYEFIELNGTEYLTVFFKGVKFKEVERLLKCYGFKK